MSLTQAQKASLDLMNEEAVLHNAMIANQRTATEDSRSITRSRIKRINAELDRYQDTEEWVASLTPATVPAVHR
jgi:hypothetical protein